MTKKKNIQWQFTEVQHHYTLIQHSEVKYSYTVIPIMQQKSGTLDIVPNTEGKKKAIFITGEF